MKNFLKNILIEPFTEDNWFSYILGGLMWILTITIVGGLLCLSIWLINSSFLTLKEKEGLVTEHYYIPAHETITYVMCGKVMVQMTNYVEDSYEIKVEIDGLTDNFCLYENSWITIKVGDKLCFKYTNGRIYKTLYIKSFCGE